MAGLCSSIWHLAFLALVALQISAQTTNSSSSSNPQIEIDVVYPANNVTYGFNYNTPWTPIVLALQGLRSAVKYTDIHFLWEVTPSENGLLSQSWVETVTSANVFQYSNDDGSPFLLVRALNFNTTGSGYHGGWNEQVRADTPNDFLLQLFITFPNINVTSNKTFANNFGNCGIPHLPTTPYSTTNFTIYPGQGSDSSTANLTAQSINTMPNAIDTCAMPVILAGVDSGSTSVPCGLFYSLPQSSATPCAAKLDANDVSSISSVASSLAMLATATTSTSSTPTPTTFHSDAIATPVPLQAPLLIAAGVLCGLPFYL